MVTNKAFSITNAQITIVIAEPAKEITADHLLPMYSSPQMESKSEGVSTNYVEDGGWRGHSNVNDTIYISLLYSKGAQRTGGPEGGLNHNFQEHLFGVAFLDS